MIRVLLRLILALILPAAILASCTGLSSIPSDEDQEFFEAESEEVAENEDLADSTIWEGEEDEAEIGDASPEHSEIEEECCDFAEEESPEQEDLDDPVLEQPEERSDWDLVDHPDRIESEAHTEEEAERVEHPEEEDGANGFEEELDLESADELADEGEERRIQRIVIAGDSWSCGIVQPTRAILDERGFGEIEVTYHSTAIAGSTAHEWATNHNGKLIALAQALDEEPAAEVLLLVIGGNDVNRAITVDNYDEMSERRRLEAMQLIENDIQTIVQVAKTGRPQLQIVLVGYDYFHYLLLQQFYDLGDLYLDEYNLIFVELGARRMALAQRFEGCHYAHNFGVLQYTFGDTIHPPFSLPLFDYPPGYVPAPGIAPNYNPYPGGFYQIPSPLNHIPDGIHPDEEGFTAIMNHVFDQGLESLIRERTWY